MDNPKFPDFIYRVTIWPGKAGSIEPEATWMAVPCRYTDVTAMTATNRRLKLEKLGRPELIAESTQTTIYRAYVRTKEEIPVVVRLMHEKMQSLVLKKIEQLEKQSRFIVLEPIIRERPFDD